MSWNHHADIACMVSLICILLSDHLSQLPLPPTFDPAWSPPPRLHYVMTKMTQLFIIQIGLFLSVKENTINNFSRIAGINWAKQDVDSHLPLEPRASLCFLQCLSLLVQAKIPLVSSSFLTNLLGEIWDSTV